MATAHVGSAAFELELGALYERYQEPKMALDHYEKALALTQVGAERAAILSAVGRARELAGDVDGAIDALERVVAQANQSGSAAAGPGPGPMPFVGGPADDAAVRLVRLLLAKGRLERAAAVCDEALARPCDPWRQEALQREQIAVLRKAGTLEGRVAALEKALAEGKAEEPGLRFLVLALGGDADRWPSAMAGPAGPPPPALVAAVDRLVAHHPEDMLARQRLQALLERAGRVEDAVRLARAGPRSPFCAAAPSFVPGSPALAGAAEAVRVRLRAGQREQALAEVGRVAALAKEEGVAALLLAADLYGELQDAPRAREALSRAARQARLREEQRQVELASVHASERGGDLAGAKARRERWRTSDDPCLRQLAEAPVAPPPMALAAPAPAGAGAR
jgi:tetratricopeptide (TPR) repeat protein